MRADRRLFLKTLVAAVTAQGSLRGAESAEQRALSTTLEEMVRTLTGRGYLVRPFAAQRPLQIAGRPALVVAVGDSHTESGVRFDEQAFRDLRDLYRLDTVLQEGRASNFDDGVRAEHAIRDYETRAVDGNLPVMTLAELNALRGPFPRAEDEYLGAAVPVRRFFSRVLGLEDDLLEMALFRDLGLGLETVQADLRSRAQAAIVCDGKYLRPEFARLHSALRELRQLSWDPLPPFDDLPLIPGTITASHGRKVSCLIVERNSKELGAALRYRDALGDRMMFNRNVAAAKNTLIAFQEFHLPSTVAAVMGRDHLRTFRNEIPYPERMRNLGISSLVLVPGPDQPSFDPNWRF